MLERREPSKSKRRVVMQQIFRMDILQTTLRVVEIEDELWFAAKDAAKALGHDFSPLGLAKLLTDNLEEFHGTQKLVEFPTLIGTEILTVLNEFGLYSLAMVTASSLGLQFRREIRQAIIEWRKSRLASVPTPALEPATVPSEPEDVEDALIRALHEMKSLRLSNEERERELTHLKLIVNNAEKTLSPKLKASIQAAVKDRMKFLLRNGYHITFQRIYSSLNARFEVSSYKEIPEEQVENAIRYIEGWRPAGLPLQEQKELFN